MVRSRSWPDTCFVRAKGGRLVFGSIDSRRVVLRGHNPGRLCGVARGSRGLVREVVAPMSETWTQKMEGSLQRLAETDEQEAQLNGLKEKLKSKAKAKHSLLASSYKGTVLERESFADNHEGYKSADAAYFIALIEHGKLKNERTTCVITIDVWRSLNAARNKGQIV